METWVFSYARTEKHFNACIRTWRTEDDVWSVTEYCVSKVISSHWVNMHTPIIPYKRVKWAKGQYFGWRRGWKGSSGALESEHNKSQISNRSVWTETLWWTPVCLWAIKYQQIPYNSGRRSGWCTPGFSESCSEETLNEESQWGPQKENKRKRTYTESFQWENGWSCSRIVNF